MFHWNDMFSECQDHWHIGVLVIDPPDGKEDSVGLWQYVTKLQSLPTAGETPPA
jgi:hypothetical protein